MIQSTIVFLVTNHNVLLGLKKRGFGEAKWNGIGGKVNEGQESVLEAARREVLEEIGVQIQQLEHVATIDFHFESRPAWDQKVSVFLCNEWTGTPQESEEMVPQWFDQSRIPYLSMWEDDIYWLPSVLARKKLTGSFWFNAKMRIQKLQIEFK